MHEVVMAQAKYKNTIDWDQYWVESDEKENDSANGSAEFLIDPFLKFIEKSGQPDSYADVGCGAGTVVFTVADHYPETTTCGFDAAESILDDNRTRAQNKKASVSFEKTVLPTFDYKQQFEMVSCFFTLCYVEDVESALQNLYEAVAPGGVLVFTYHNKLAQAQFREIAQSPDTYLNESTRFDPDTYTERFESVLKGQSLLSYETIHECLGTWPQSVWSVTEDTERYAAWRQNPFVYVPK